MSEFYGDSFRWFVGKVASVTDDPSQTGRIKVKIFGLHDDPSLKLPDDLPWAQVLAPTTEGGGSGIGNNGIGIQPQSLVFGIFLDSKESQMPLVLGSIPTTENFHQDLSSIGDATASQLAPGKYSTYDHTSEMYEQEKNTQNTGSANTQMNSYKLPGNSNVEKAFLWFMSEAGGGYTAEQSAGLIGNFWIESGPGGGGIPNDIDPTAENPTQEASRGIAQWNPQNKGQARDYVRPDSRLAGLQRFASYNKLWWLDLYTQLQWVTKELETMGLKGKLLKCKTTAEAAYLICRRYEVPKGYKDYYSATNRKRREAAAMLLDQLTTGSS